MLKKRCVLFGGGGFIGSCLTEALLTQNYEVLVYARGSKRDRLNLARVINKISFIKGDIDDIKLVQQTVKPNDFIFNLVSSSLPSSSMNNPLDEINHHIFTNVLLAQTLFKIGVKKYIFTSSGGGIYGQKTTLPILESSSIQPSSPHAIAKATIEFYVRYFSDIYNIPSLTYRIGNAYGARQIMQPGFGIIPTIIHEIKEKTPPTLFNKGNCIRDFIYIDDLIDAIIISFDKDTTYDIYNIGSGCGTSIHKIWKILKNFLNVTFDPIYAKKRPIDTDKVILDISRFSNEFKWKPRFNINEGLKTTVLNITNIVR